MLRVCAERAGMNKNMDEKSKLNIRNAGIEDAELAVKFIKKLGAYQKMSDKTTITEEKFTELITEGRGEAIFGEIDGKPVAFIYYFGNSTAFIGVKGLYIDVFYVDEDYRSTGVGKTMMKYMANLALERGCGRLEWVCFDWNESAIGFYKGLGADAYDMITTYRMSRDRIELLAEEIK